MANTNDGWIKTWRKLTTNKLWLEKPFSKGQAWIDLLMFATQNTHTSIRNGVHVVYEAGCVYESVKGLANRWGWSRPRVYRFFEELKSEGMIDYQKRTQNRTSNVTQSVTQLVTPLRIVNWELYQDKRTLSDTQIRTSYVTRKRTHPKKDIYPKKDISKEEESAPLIPFPCGVAVKPEWMDEDLWNDVRFRKVEDIPTLLQGDFNTYMEFAEEAHRRGEDKLL